MHIPDGYLGPQTYTAMFGVMTPFWIIAARKVRDSMRIRQIPLLAMGAVFSFVIMMFNIPAPGGSTGHAVGGALIGIVLGPWAATMAISAALIVQALLFGDGGITCIGANCFNMAVVMPFSAYAVYKLVSAGANASDRRRVIAAAIAGYSSLNLSALITAIEFGIQPMLAHRPDGTPLYAPYPLHIAVPAMMIEHLLVFGFIEAAATGLVVSYLLKSDRSILGLGEASHSEPKSNRRLWWGIGGLVILAPLGLIAAGTAWGEWAPDELKSKTGFVPAGLAKLEGVWHAAMPDYYVNGLGSAPLAYIVSAIIGVGVTAILVFILARAISIRKAR